MNIIKKIVTLACIVVLGISACNLPAQEETTTPIDPVAAASATLMAMTLEMQPNQPQATEIPSSTPLPTDTPTITPTSTPTVPMVTVSVNTNCRTGPGVVYDLIGGLLVGEEAVVVGKYSAGNYWIINNPDSSGTCWLWGQYATVTGNIDGLPEYTPPPTPTPTSTPTPTATPTLAPPNAPENVSASKACTPLVLPQYLLVSIITWDDKSNNETGFNVYRNGALLTTVGPNITTWNDTFPINMGMPVTYGVEAVNAAGVSTNITATAVTCP